MIHKHKTKDESPLKYLSPRRIDIAAKTAFARAFVEDNNSKWPEEVYKEHIRAFNGFFEKAPRKTCYKDFKDSFVETIKYIKDDSPSKPISAIPVHGNDLLDGAHRLSASIVLGKKITTIAKKETYNPNYGYEYFSRVRGNINKIDDSVLDYMTIEYVSLKKNNVFVAIVFPTAEGHREDAEQHFKKLGEIINKKSFKHDEFIGKEVIKQLYFGDEDKWNHGLGFYGAENKARACFNGTNSLDVYVLEANLDETTRVKEKQYLRNLWGKEKHSIHITDTAEEANRVVRMFFNENSRRVMQVDRKEEFCSHKTLELINEYTELLPTDVFEREKTAITGSVAFDLLGLRPARDLDYITRDKNLEIEASEIDKHDDAENIYHTQNIDELLSNPKYYFYYKGLKFIDILELKQYKQNRKVRGEKKDIQDIKMIEEFITKNTQYSDTIKNMKQLPKISIIVPVYNTEEKYLEPCINSIQAQEYNNLEIIIVDDGSDRPTSKWLDSRIKELSSRDKDRTWKVIHQKNKGLSGARNTGYKAATGKYVQFLDGDDYFEGQLIKKAYEKAEKTKADVVVENYTIKDYETGAEFVAFTEESFPSIEIFSIDDLEGNKLQTVPHNVWSKLFLKKFIDEQKLFHDEELYRAEDVLYTLSALMKTKKIAAVFEPGIHYRRNLPNSNTKNNDSHPDVSVKSWKKLREFLIRNKLYKSMEEDYEKAMLDSLKWHHDRMYTEKGRVSLAKAAKNFFKKIELNSTKHDYLIITELLNSSPQYLSIFEEKNKSIEQLKADIVETRNKVKVRDEKIRALYEQIKTLNDQKKELLEKINSYQGLKASGRLLASSIKQRIKRIISR